MVITGAVSHLNKRQLTFLDHVALILVPTLDSPHFLRGYTFLIREFTHHLKSPSLVNRPFIPENLNSRKEMEEGGDAKPLEGAEQRPQCQEWRRMGVGDRLRVED